mmetsp:Transcript_4747/g.14314  ORF Transcript_4747/g.14314 Transcript_4747/m.14314 type:complete len:320 (-) Transcript_4747:754-1713(-)
MCSFLACIMRTNPARMTASRWASSNASHQRSLFTSSTGPCCGGVHLPTLTVPFSTLNVAFSHWRRSSLMASSAASWSFSSSEHSLIAMARSKSGGTSLSRSRWPRNVMRTTAFFSGFSRPFGSSKMSGGRPSSSSSPPLASCAASARRQTSRVPAMPPPASTKICSASSGRYCGPPPLLAPGDLNEDRTPAGSSTLSSAARSSSEMPYTPASSARGRPADAFVTDSITCASPGSSPSASSVTSSARSNAFFAVAVASWPPSASSTVVTPGSGSAGASSSSMIIACTGAAAGAAMSWTSSSSIAPPPPPPPPKGAGMSGA